MRNMWRILLISSASAFSCKTVTAQDYREYHQALNRIDEDLFNGDTTTAISRLDTVYVNYPFIYAKHCIKGLQIATSIQNELLADKWLAKCFMQGVPIWVLRQNEITMKALAYPSCEHTITAYDSLRGIYQTHINTEVKAEIEHLMKIDTRFTNRVNNGFFLFRHTLHGLRWMHNNKKSYRHIQHVTEQYGFPGERLIGLPLSIEDSSELGPYIAHNGIEMVVQNRQAFFMLLHYYSTKRKNNLNTRLYTDMLNGFIQPYQYGRINDYMATSGKIKADNVHRYYVQGDRPPPSTIELNLLRNSIGLNSHEQQWRNSQWTLEHCKKGDIGRTIIME